MEITLNTANSNTGTSIIPPVPLSTPANIGTGITQAGTVTIPAVPLSTATEAPVLYPHEQLLSEEKLDMKALPKEIRNQVNAWNLQRLRFDKTKSENIGMTVRKKSVVIADMIQNHLEKDLPEQVIPVTPPVEIKKDEKKIFRRPSGLHGTDETVDGENKGTENPDESTFGKPTNLKKNISRKETEQERLILKNIDDKGYIHYNKLGEILGIKTFGFVIRVSEKMVLDNEYMSDYYKIRKSPEEKK